MWVRLRCNGCANAIRWVLIVRNATRYFLGAAIVVKIVEHLRDGDVQQLRMRLHSRKRGNASAVPPQGGQRKCYSHGSRVPPRQPGRDFVGHNEGVLVHLEKRSTLSVPTDIYKPRMCASQSTSDPEQNSHRPLFIFDGLCVECVYIEVA